MLGPSQFFVLLIIGWALGIFILTPLVYCFFVSRFLDENNRRGILYLYLMLLQLLIGLVHNSLIFLLVEFTAYELNSVWTLILSLVLFFFVLVGFTTQRYAVSIVSAAKIGFGVLLAMILLTFCYAVAVFTLFVLLFVFFQFETY